MDWIKLLQLLVPVAVTVAESIHPLGENGKTKLATATTFVQMGLGMAAAAGAIPPGVAIQTKPIVDAINANVAQQNKAGGVKPIQP